MDYGEEQAENLTKKLGKPVGLESQLVIKSSMALGRKRESFNMSITKADVEHIAKLARIEVKEEDKDKLAQELGSILDYVAKLNEVDTEGVEPTAQVTGLENVFRPDEAKVSDENAVGKLLDAMPAREGRHLKVKSVFDHR